MDSLRRLLPSPGGLIAFEAAGRLGTFTVAARELGISQAAVSYAVRRLEQQFRAPLFQREHRRVELTEAGARFFVDVSLAHVTVSPAGGQWQARAVGAPGRSSTHKNVQFAGPGPCSGIAGPPEETPT